MSDPIFVDGYTATFKIPAVKGMHGELTGHYRPALDEDALEAYAGNPTGKDLAIARAKLIASHVKDWSVKEPVTAENVRRLHRGLIKALEDKVMGYAPADQEADAKN